MTERYKGYSILITKVSLEDKTYWEYNATKTIDGKKAEIFGTEYPGEIEARISAREIIDALEE